MKKKNVVAIVLSGIFIFSILAFKIISSTWKINSGDAKITWTLSTGKHTGTIGNLNATIDFDPMHPEVAAIKATVDVKSIDAGNNQLNEHLQTPDFFDAANHPQITFTAEQITKNDSGFVATGKLAMRDSVHTISIPFKFSDDGKNATIKGTMDIFSGDYGVGKKSAEGKDRVIITIEVPMMKE